MSGQPNDIAAPGAVWRGGHHYNPPAGMDAAPTMPPLGVRVRNLGASLRAILAHLRDTGQAIAEAGVRKGRARTCKRGAGLKADQISNGHCDQWIASMDSCALCGCFLPAKRAAAPKLCERWGE